MDQFNLCYWLHVLVLDKYLLSEAFVCIQVIFLFIMNMDYVNICCVAYFHQFRWVSYWVLPLLYKYTIKSDKSHWYSQTCNNLYSLCSTDHKNDFFATSDIKGWICHGCVVLLWRSYLVTVGGCLWNKPWCCDSSLCVSTLWSCSPFIATAGIDESLWSPVNAPHIHGHIVVLFLEGSISISCGIVCARGHSGTK